MSTALVPLKYLRHLDSVDILPRRDKLMYDQECHPRRAFPSSSGIREEGRHVLAQAWRRPELMGPPQSYFSEARYSGCVPWDYQLSAGSPGPQYPVPLASRRTCCRTTCKRRCIVRKVLSFEDKENVLELDIGESCTT